MSKRKEKTSYTNLKGVCPRCQRAVRAEFARDEADVLVVVGHARHLRGRSRRTQGAGAHVTSGQQALEPGPSAPGRAGQGSTHTHTRRATQGGRTLSSGTFIFLPTLSLLTL